MGVLIEVEDGQAQESRTNSMPINTGNQDQLDYDYSYVPWEIWFEILSKLQIKSLFVCQVVCKIWKKIVSQVTKNIEPLPLCGLVLRKGLGSRVYLQPRYFHTTYICLTTKATLDRRELSITSGYDQGLIAKLKFDFGELDSVNNPSNPERKPTSIVSHKGLLLVDYTDTYEVHNPVTKQVFTVPKSELCNGAPGSRRGSCGFIINLSHRPGIKCSFVIMKFSRKFRKIEMYYSVTKRWSEELVGLRNDVVMRAHWALDNYVAIYKKTKTLSFYFLTDAYHGVVLNFHNPSDPKAESFAFPLPNSPLLHWNDGQRRKIWESEKNLFLSYSDPTRLKIWKAGSTSFDETWAWVPQLEISNSDPLRNVAGSGREDIVKLLNAGGRLKPLAFHPYDPIIYLLVEENIFSYHLVHDTLVDIAKINDADLFKNANGILGYPFIPCIASFS